MLATSLHLGVSYKFLPFNEHHSLDQYSTPPMSVSPCRTACFFHAFLKINSVTLEMHIGRCFSFSYQAPFTLYLEAEQVLILASQHTQISSELCLGEDRDLQGVKMTHTSAPILKGIRGVVQCAVLGSFVRMLCLTATTVGVVDMFVCMSQFVVMVHVQTLEVILNIVGVVLRSVRAKVGAPMPCVIMVDNRTCLIKVLQQFVVLFGCVHGL